MKDSNSHNSATYTDQLGSKADFRREARHSVLKAHTFAGALADVFRAAGANEKMTFALFGHWGRGKSRLLKLLSERIQRPKSEGDWQYEVVWFSAWKYKTSPEIWAYLFQRFSEKAMKSSWVVPIRGMYYRHGPWPLINALFGLFFSLMTISEQISILSWAVQIFGVSTVVYVIFLFAKFRNTAVRLRDLYAVSDHADQLGLQAAIGEDLAALLKSWTPGHVELKFSIRDVFAFVCYSIGCSLVIWKTYLLTNSEGNLLASISIAVLVTTSVGLPVTIFSDYFWPKKSRVLLIVDDLDRCDPDRMLDIIESIMLIVDDPEVRSRLQIAMAIDEGIFKSAVVSKYRSVLLRNSKKEGVDFPEERIIRESLEKFFLVHFRLPELSEEGIRDIVHAYTAELSDWHDYSDEVDEFDLQEYMDDHVSQRDYETSGSPFLRTFGMDSIVISPTEGGKIIKVLSQLKQEHTFGPTGPRTIRCLLFKYQLARNIALRLGHPVDPEVIVASIARQYVNLKDTNFAIQPSIDEEIDSIVQHVI